MHCECSMFFFFVFSESMLFFIIWSHVSASDPLQISYGLVSEFCFRIDIFFSVGFKKNKNISPKLKQKYGFRQDIILRWQKRRYWHGSIKCKNRQILSVKMNETFVRYVIHSYLTCTIHFFWLFSLMKVKGVTKYLQNTITKKLQ